MAPGLFQFIGYILSEGNIKFINVPEKFDVLNDDRQDMVRLLFIDQHLVKRMKKHEGIHNM